MIPRAGMNRFAHHLWVATRDNKWLVLIVLVALFARITWSLAHVEAPSSDAAVYDRLARDLASGVGYVNEEGLPTAYMPVGYPAFLAAIYMIFGHSWTAGVIANAFVSSLSVLLAYILYHFSLMRPHSIWVSPERSA